MRKLDRIDLGTAERVGIWSAAIWSLSVLAALPAGPDKALGLAAGGGIILGFFALHLALARQWTAHPRPRFARIYLWFIWLLKWPACGLLLYLAIASGRAHPIWLCLGAGIVPLVATTLALRMLLRGRALPSALEGAS
jgi:hypothetical protein